MCSSPALLQAETQAQRGDAALAAADAARAKRAPGAQSAYDRLQRCRSPSPPAGPPNWGPHADSRTSSLCLTLRACAAPAVAEQQKRCLGQGRPLLACSRRRDPECARCEFQSISWNGCQILINQLGRMPDRYSAHAALAAAVGVRADRLTRVSTCKLRSRHRGNPLSFLRALPAAGARGAARRAPRPLPAAPPRPPGAPAAACPGAAPEICRPHKRQATGRGDRHSKNPVCVASQPVSISSSSCSVESPLWSPRSQLANSFLLLLAPSCVLSTALPAGHNAMGAALRPSPLF